MGTVAWHNPASRMVGGLPGGSNQTVGLVRFDPLGIGLVVPVTKRWEPSGSIRPLGSSLGSCVRWLGHHDVLAGAHFLGDPLDHVVDHNRT